MNIEKYQRKINDVITKCPIETGVEILVYNLLDEYINADLFSLVDINRVWKRKDPRLKTVAGISDIAVLSNDFVFGDEAKGRVFGFVEVKKPGTAVRETEQSMGEASSVSHFIYTNGLVWKYYRKGDIDSGWSINLLKNHIKYSLVKVIIDQDAFCELIDRIKMIEWDKNDV